MADVFSPGMHKLTTQTLPAKDYLQTGTSSNPLQVRFYFSPIRSGERPTPLPFATRTSSSACGPRYFHSYHNVDPPSTRRFPNPRRYTRSRKQPKDSSEFMVAGMTDLFKESGGLHPYRRPTRTQRVWQGDRPRWTASPIWPGPGPRWCRTSPRRRTPENPRPEDRYEHDRRHTNSPVPVANSIPHAQNEGGMAGRRWGWRRIRAGDAAKPWRKPCSPVVLRLSRWWRRRSVVASADDVVVDLEKFHG